jgi:hypothetical protein
MWVLKTIAGVSVFAWVKRYEVLVYHGPFFLVILKAQ